MIIVPGVEQMTDEQALTALKKLGYEEAAARFILSTLRSKSKIEVD